MSVSYTHLRAHETVLDLVCRLLTAKKKILPPPPRLKITSIRRIPEFAPPAFTSDSTYRLSSINGAAFGLEPILTQSAWFRPHNRSEEVDRLYLVGAGTHPGAGLPGVLSSARILDKVVPHGDSIAHTSASDERSPA